MFVVELAGVQAVMKLAEELVEQVSLGLVVPVSGGAAGVVVAAGAGRGAQRSQGPDGADGGQPPILDMPVQDNGFLPAGAGDGRRSGERLQPAGVNEAGAVIPDLGEHPGAGQQPQTGEDISWSEESSRYREWRAESVGFVVELVGVQAVMQLSEELVEQVPLRLGVTVPVVSASPVMRVGSRRRPQRTQGPQEPGMGESLIFDVAVSDDTAFAAGAGDRRGARIGFQRSGIGEPCSVVADFGEHPGGGQRTQTGETQQDPASGCLSNWAIAAAARSSAAAQAASSCRSRASIWWPIADSTWAGWRR